MLLLLTLALLQQAPTEPTCVANGRVCGMECVTAGQEAACAQTKKGACINSAVAVSCFDPALELLAQDDVPKATCVLSAGAMACGYHCVKSAGRAACAKTPAGVCESHGGRLTCNDPPPETWLVRSPVPPMTCTTKTGTTACGYSCRSNARETRCAQTPLGACAQAGGSITCFDPSARLLRTLGKGLAAATCLTSGPRVACGYQCLEGAGEVGCALTPLGSCKATSGKVICVDPQ